MKLVARKMKSKKVGVALLIVFFIICSGPLFNFVEKYRNNWCTNSGQNNYKETMYQNTDRLNHLKQACASSNTTFIGTDCRSRFLTDSKGKITLCFVPKVGCTFWKRVFLVLNSHEGENRLGIVLNAQRNMIHETHFETLDRLSFDQTLQFLKSAHKILFTRNPYTRLFSAYVDKFILADFWGSKFGITTIEQFRDAPNLISVKCTHDVTFGEFLHYVLLYKGNDSSTGGEEHWFPISKLCRPCLIDYDVIGNQETFDMDRDYILSNLGMQEELSKLVSRETSDLVSMKQTAAFVWNRIQKLPKICQNNSMMFDSLLRGFRHQGFLPEDIEMPWADVNTVSRLQFMEFIKSEYIRQDLTPSEYNKRRKNAMLSAYREIDTSTLVDVQHMFHEDFRLFNYDPFPEEIFGGRKDFRID